MSLFEYLGILISVVMGLGIAHLLTGTAKLIQGRATLNIYVPHVVWTANVLLFIMSIWWGMFWWSKLEAWSFFNFLFITFYAIALYLMCSMLYPRAFPSDFDFESYFFDNRRWFFGIMLIAWMLDIFETTGKAYFGLRDLPEFYALFIGVNILIAIAGIVSGNRRLHKALPILWLVPYFSILAFTTLSQIASA